MQGGLIQGKDRKMREILFKVKELTMDYWHEGLLTRLDQDICHIKDNLHSEWICKSETICQYTGLTDKNGIRIFEGDVVEFQFDKDDCSFSDKDTKKRIGRVYFEEFRASFAIAMGRNGSSVINNDLFKYVQNGNRVSVIGNIHDNPELLGGE